jgi:hypothetical protein
MIGASQDNLIVAYIFGWYIMDSLKRNGAAKMAHSDFMAMKVAFKAQFGYHMIESGHDVTSVQFFVGWKQCSLQGA